MLEEASEEPGFTLTGYAGAGFAPSRTWSLPLLTVADRCFLPRPLTADAGR